MKVQLTAFSWAILAEGMHSAPVLQCYGTLYSTACIGVVAGGMLGFHSSYNCCDVHLHSLRPRWFMSGVVCLMHAADCNSNWMRAIDVYLPVWQP